MLVSSYRVVLVFCCTLLISRTVESFSSVLHVSRNLHTYSARSAIPSETVEGYTFAERTVNNVTVVTGGDATGKPKRTVVSKNPRDWTPYNFRDKDGEYDVPFINVAMWYRLSVRRNSEKKLAESLKLLRDSDETWGSMFEEIYYPQQPVVRIKDKSLVIAFKAMAPGLVYVKTKMNPDLADDIESLKGVYAFIKNPNNLIVPLSPDEGESIEVMRDRNTATIDPELMLMKKDEYVSVVSGPRKGRYGILMGAKNGKLEVCLRSEYKDDWDTFEFDQLRYLADPPEKKWMLLTPKEALESLMAKDPYNPTVKAFKKNGLLEEILYPDGRPEGRYNDRQERGDRGDRDVWAAERKPRENRYDSASDSQGREGGRSLRSIASEKPSSSSSSSSSGRGSSSSDTDDWGASSSAKSTAPITSGGGAFTDSFNIAAWGDSLSSVTGQRAQTDKKSFKEDNYSSREKVPEPAVAAAGGGPEDFDSFIQGLLQDMDGPGTPAASEDNKVAASPAASGEGNRVIVTGEKREWIPSKERLQQQSQQQQQPPRQERKRDDSYTASTSKSNDWFDERSSYDTFGSRPDTNTRSTRTNTNPQVEADRLDSERILNELLMDLDSVNPRSSTDSDGGVDYFDFSVDSDDVNGKDKSASKSRQPPSRAPASSAQAGGNRNVAPKMEDFASFEQYLDALVSHERTSSSAGSKSSWDSSRTGGRVPDNRANTKVDKVEMDALDDTLVAFLGADDEDDMSGRLRSQSNSRSGDRSGDAPKRSWNPKPSSPSVMSEVKSDDKIDDLSSFLDSLEESNVLPSKSKIVDVVAPKAVEVPVVTEKKVAKKSTPAPVKAPEPVAAVAEVQSVGGFTSLSLKDLKDILRERGLPVSGNKADLVKRLNQ